MKRFLIQRYLSGGWFFGITFWGLIVSLGLFLSVSFYDDGNGFLFAILAGAIAGFISVYFPFLFLVFIVSKINGAPFYKGDVVQILVGKHMGEIVTVYEEWKDRKQVRVDLDEQAKDEVEDVFSFVEIRRVKSN